MRRLVPRETHTDKSTCANSYASSNQEIQTMCQTISFSHPIFLSGQKVSAQVKLLSWYTANCAKLSRMWGKGVEEGRYHKAVFHCLQAIEKQKGMKHCAGCQSEKQYMCQAPGASRHTHCNHILRFPTRTVSVSQLHSCHLFSTSALPLLTASQWQTLRLLVPFVLCFVLLWACICRKEASVAFLTLQLKANNHKIKPDNLPLFSQTFPARYRGCWRWGHST